MSVAIAVQTVDLYPPRVLVTVTGLTLGDDVTIYRVVDGERTLVRAGTRADVTDPSFLAVDAEVPFGIPVSYVAIVNSSTEYASTPVTHDLPGGKVVLTDAITGLAVETEIFDWPEKTYTREASVFKVGGRNIVVSGGVGQFEGTISLLMREYSATEQFMELWGNATENILQIRRPTIDYDGIDCYVSILGAREQRLFDDFKDGERLWVLEVVETDEWSSAYEARAFTLGDIANYYGPTGTLQDIDNDFTSLLGIAQGDFS